MTDFEQSLLNEFGRIADALESIDDNLEKCVGYEPPRRYQEKGFYFLRVGGQVYAD